MAQRKKTLENIVGKEQNAIDQHFLFFIPGFLSLRKTNFNFFATFIFSLVNAFTLTLYHITKLGFDQTESSCR